jgi:hypothetical protein
MYVERRCTSHLNLFKSHYRVDAQYNSMNRESKAYPDQNVFQIKHRNQPLSHYQLLVFAFKYLSLNFFLNYFTSQDESNHFYRLHNYRGSFFF